MEEFSALERMDDWDYAMVFIFVYYTFFSLLNSLQENEIEEEEAKDVDAPEEGIYN